MTILYVVEQGATLRRNNDRLNVEKSGEILASVPAIKVEQVVIFGNVQVTTPVVVLMLTRGIDCTVRTVGLDPYNGFLHACDVYHMNPKARALTACAVSR